MSSRDNARLPEAAEAMLRDWPAPERDEAHWEDTANSIASRLEQSRAEPVSDRLLEPPLPAEPAEGSLDPAEAHGAQRPRRLPRRTAPGESAPSLAEMARARVKTKDRRQEATTMAKESLSLLKEARNTGALASTVAAAAGSRDRPAQKRQPEVLDLEEARSRRESEARQDAMQQARRSASSASRHTTVALAVIAVAACVVLLLYSRDRTPKGQVVAVAPTPVELEQTPHRAQPPAAEHDEVLDSEQLPTLEDGPAAARRPGGIQSGKTDRRRKSTRNEDKAQPPKRGEMAPPATEQLDGTDSDEEDELRPALEQGAVPLEPSTGAVSSALGSALGAARRCVIGHARSSSANIVFGSNGRVRSVTVSGPAAGTSADPCIQSALGQARLPRFAKPTFTVRGVTIRP